MHAPQLQHRAYCGLLMVAAPSFVMCLTRGLVHTCILMLAHAQCNFLYFQKLQTELLYFKLDWRPPLNVYQCMSQQIASHRAQVFIYASRSTSKQETLVR